MDVRLFAAVWPDPAARDALDLVLEPVRVRASAIRWQPPERWHITTAFLGMSDPERATARIDTVMSRDISMAQPLRLVGSGTFGPVVWTGVAHGPWLGELAGRLQRALHTEDRRFHAHLTVGRARGANAPQLAREAAELLAAKGGLPWTPREITLVASEGGPRPRYEVIAAWPLPGTPPAHGPG